MSNSNSLSIEGQRFGFLVAMSPLPERKRGKVVWRFQCDCGKTIDRIATVVKNGGQKSCGCSLATNLVGKKFGRLTVLSRSLAEHAGTSRNYRWNCMCDCGKTFTADAGSLKRGRTKSCGCLHKQVAAQNCQKDNVDYLSNDFAYASRTSCLYLVEVAHRVDKLGIAFSLKNRKTQADYTTTWFERQMNRAQCWAVEQVALSLTTDYRPAQPYIGNGNNGPTEQRTGWVLEDVITMLNELCDECLALGWDVFYNKYAPFPQNV